MTDDAPFTRTQWARGPWDDEPDRVQWVTRVGLPAILRRNPMLGTLCGYVAVAMDHPFFGYPIEMPGLPSVHGGITWAGSFLGGDPRGEYGQDVVPGAPYWWFGFDGGHAGFDLVPLMEGSFLRSQNATLKALLEKYPAAKPVYRDVPYMTAECEALAEALSK